MAHEQLIEIIFKFNPKKAHGPDEISIAMLETCAAEVAVPLKLIFDECLLTGTFPDSWKCANVQSVHKKNNRQLITNYRPITDQLPSNIASTYFWKDF